MSAAMAVSHIDIADIDCSNYPSACRFSPDAVGDPFCLKNT
jgi:hypothetical protein